MSPDILGQLLGLIALEVILGVDNLIIISVLADRLPPNQRARGRRVGLFIAMGLRLLLLFAIDWLMAQTNELFSIGKTTFSFKDLILIVGGGFLLYQSGKALLEIRSEGGDAGTISESAEQASWSGVMVQMALMNIVFSIDAVITAIGVTDHVWVMAVAMIVAVGVMAFAAEPMVRLIDDYPPLKIMALSLLLIIGSILVAEGFGIGIPKWIVYSVILVVIGLAVIQIRQSRQVKSTG